MLSGIFKSQICPNVKKIVKISYMVQLSDLFCDKNLSFFFKKKSPLAFCTVAKFENVLWTLSNGIFGKISKKSLDKEVEFATFRLCGLKGSQKDSNRFHKVGSGFGPGSWVFKIWKLGFFLVRASLGSISFSGFNLPSFQFPSSLGSIIPVLVLARLGF